MTIKFIYTSLCRCHRLGKKKIYWSRSSGDRLAMYICISFTHMPLAKPWERERENRGEANERASEREKIAKLACAAPVSQNWASGGDPMNVYSGNVADRWVICRVEGVESLGRWEPFFCSTGRVLTFTRVKEKRESLNCFNDVFERLR